MSEIAQTEATNRALLWFAALLALMVGFQVVRLGQDDPANWLVVDYLMRAATLFLLGVSPMRHAIFAWGRIAVPRRMFILWCGVLVAGAWALTGVANIYNIGDLLPETRFGFYPRPTPMQKLVDLTFGVALVAVHEEMFFRRFARVAFQRLGDGALMIAVTSVVFGAYHWWSGVPNCLLAAAFGVLFMLFYRRTEVIWPVILVHYAVDVYAFW